VLDAPRRNPYRAVEETTEAKEGPAPSAPSGDPAQSTPPAGSGVDRRVTGQDLHGKEAELPPTNTQPLDISAVRRAACAHACCAAIASRAPAHRLAAGAPARC
jgi:hypothetical protein